MLKEYIILDIFNNLKALPRGEIVFRTKNFTYVNLEFLLICRIENVTF